MRILHLGLAITLMVCSTLRAQDNPNQQQQPDQQQQTDQPQRPTLGKRAPDSGAASPGGPHSSTVTDERKLMHIRTVYVDRIDNQLSDKLTEGLAKMGRFRIVAERKDADAVLTGTCFDSRHLKQLHSEVFLNDRASGSSIWQDIVRRPYNPPSLAESVQDSADLIVAHLSQTLREADRK
ncbi:MAG TPA: hypothetical protein VKM93_08685 [Terriglobia bacterium]|nr:hypothetical protein [Terriglobia bacterium]